MFGRITLSKNSAPRIPPMIGPIVVAISDRPLFGPGKATEPKPITNNMSRGPRSRAGLKHACVMGAMNMISRPIVAPTINGKNHADGALTCRVSSRDKDHQEQDGRAEDLTGQALQERHGRVPARGRARDPRVRGVGGQGGRQPGAFRRPDDDVLRRGQVEQVPAEHRHQNRGPQEPADDLAPDVERHQSPGVPAGDRQRDRHRRVEVRPGQGRGDIDAQRDRHGPAPRSGPDVGEPR